jgi:hypothetical protein
MLITQVVMPQYSIFTDTSAVGSPADAIKLYPGTIYWISADNTANGSICYVQVFNKAAGDVTVGTTSADFIMAVGGSSEETYNFSTPLAFSVGLSAAVTTTPSGNTTTSSPVILTIAYN